MSSFVHAFHPSRSPGHSASQALILCLCACMAGDLTACCIASSEWIGCPAGCSTADGRSDAMILPFLSFPTTYDDSSGFWQQDEDHLVEKLLCVSMRLPPLPSRALRLPRDCNRAFSIKSETHRAGRSDGFDPYGQQGSMVALEAVGGSLVAGSNNTALLQVGAALLRRGQATAAWGTTPPCKSRRQPPLSHQQHPMLP